mgnify:CR=1 FL=1
MRNIYRIGVLLVMVLTMASCSSDGYSEYERVKATFLGELDGDISAGQMWRTAVKLNVKVVNWNAPTKLWLMSAEEDGTLYDYREAAANSTTTMIAPQGQGNTLYLVGISGMNKSVMTVNLSGKTVENVTMDFAETRSMDAAKASVTNGSLYGRSILGNSEYNQLTDEQLAEGFKMLETSYIEYVKAKDLGLNCNYELESNGDFEITWYAGNCMSYTPHILGYYYHSPDTYDDIQYVDISETEIYDYIDGKAKVQYMVNQDAAERFGVTANKWYDANFDMGDTFENPSPNMAVRAGDDAYNTMSVYDRYGNDITAIRGISFTIKVPKGMRVGFYNRIGDVAQPEQYDRLVKMGIKPYTSRAKFKAMNFSCEEMNMNMKGSYRSCIVESAHSYWLGMENDYTGGDLDCNDVIFQISSKLDIHMPNIVTPEVKPNVFPGDKMPWTLAFEDVYRNADFDFNDAVIKLVPDYENERCCVTVMAAGSTDRMYLHYDGPDGDMNLGEIHSLLGGTADKPINTNSSMPTAPFVQVDCVPWSRDYDIQQDARRFYIEVKRGTCRDCSDILQLPDEPGLLPQAVLVADEWKWPREGVHITKAYNTFANWCKDVTKPAYWSWYVYPNSNTCVNY